ncbi:hypothetical protein RN22_09755 [Grimontia sp. AD028]|uniref:hypothetical protein n=1 Tax=Grimontia sp. AD028 TaxID=1581149 RepID=UPI00061AA1D6|nr:hypothetical protein [Grimontia sp. AD028]KKD60686.1 hypothetical protein RN22_09755 [Grimontia sp. AD028]
MLDRLDCLHKLLPSGSKHSVVPMYMFANDAGLPVVLRLNIRGGDKSLPVMVVAFDIDTLAKSVHCEIQYPREKVNFKLYGQLTSSRFHIGTHEITSWESLEKLAIQWLRSPETTT